MFDDPPLKHQDPPSREKWRTWYNTAYWRRLRKAQLTIHPLCRFCELEERVVSASVVDHLEPHRGDRQLFFDGRNLQSLCKPCHDRIKQREERHGHSGRLGRDGWPIDPRHPANAIPPGGESISGAPELSTGGEPRRAAPRMKTRG